jgi:hypothetical protein
LARVFDLIVPVLGIYAGQYLISAIAKAPGWGLAVIAVSLALLNCGTSSLEGRLRPATAKEPALSLSKGLADAVQTLLGLLLGLPLALNAGEWKGWTPAWQLILVWLLSCLLVITAVFKLKPQPIKLGLAPIPQLDKVTVFDWRDWLAIALLVGAALLLRVPNIETIPLGVDPDEASLSQMAVNVITGENKDPFATGWATHPTLEFFINSAFVRLFGRSFLAMRLPWAIIGALAVATIYLLARAGYGRRRNVLFRGVAILAGALIAGSSVAIQFSRLGLNNVGDTLFVTWVLAALWIAGATGSPRAYAMAGVGLGLAQYYYFGTRAIPFVVIATLLVWLIADWRGVRNVLFRGLRAWYLRNVLFRGLLGSALVALRACPELVEGNVLFRGVVVGPLAGHWLLHPNAISEHLFLTLPFTTCLQQETARTHLPAVAILWQRVRDSLLIFTMTRDNGSFYTARQRNVLFRGPMLNSRNVLFRGLQAPFFLIGVLAIFAGWRRAINQGLLVWIAAERPL